MDANMAKKTNPVSASCFFIFQMRSVTT